MPFFLIFFVVQVDLKVRAPLGPSPLGLTIHVKPDNPRHARQSTSGPTYHAKPSPLGLTTSPRPPFQTKVNAIWEKPTFI